MPVTSAHDSTTARKSADPADTVWRPVERSRAYELVVDRVEEQILSGALAVGDRLPSERDLAAMLEVSRAAVREAIRALEAQGVVRSELGRDGGTVVCALPAQALAHFLRLHVALANFAVTDVVDARIMLERESAGLAARRATPQEKQELADLVARMDAALDDRDAFNELDTAFHVAIAEAGGNLLVADMTTAIRDSLRRPILRAFHAVQDWPELAAGLQEGHHRVIEAILDGDAAAAADAVEAHIRSAHDALGYAR